MHEAFSGLRRGWDLDCQAVSKEGSSLVVAIHLKTKNLVKLVFRTAV